MIYPYSLLANLVDKPINSLTFYSSSNITDLKDGIFNIKIGTTSTTQFGSSPTRITGLTTVVTTNMTACQSGRNLVINFDQTFTYTQSDYNSGKNLVIEFESTSTGEYQGLSFYGVNNYSNSSYYNGNNTTTRYSFLPKVTFGLLPTDPIISASPTLLSFEAIPNVTQTLPVTVTGQNLTGNITATLNDANGVFSMNNGTNPVNLGNGGTLNISYSPTDLGTHTATVTLTSAGADPVYINLNGTCEKAVTACDGTDTNGNLPIYGYYIDNYQINQMIYPESELTNLVGKDLTSMTFYTSGNIHQDLETSTWTVKLGTTDETVFASTLANSTRLEPDNITEVKADYVVTSGINTMTIVFDTPFSYYGGNLLVDFESTAHTSDYEATNFYGVTQSSGHNTGFHSYGSSNTPGTSGHYSGGDIDAFLPKVKFTYVESEPITNGTVTPNSVALSAAVGNTATQTVTVRNTGNQPFTPTINATNLPQGITVSPTTSGQVAPGGTLNLTVTFTPTAETSYSGSFTVTIPVPDGDDIVVTVNVTGSGYVVSSKLTSNTVEIPVYKSEAKADGTYIFSKDDVDDDIDMSLSYGSGDVSVEVLVKDDEPITSYDLRHKVGTGSWTSVATATQDASDPKSYVYNNDTFVIPSDATQMWLSMTDEGVDATSTIYYVPVTVANGVVTQGNTYGAPQVTATTVNLEPTLSIGGSKSAGRPGGHWTQSINGTDVDYCVYTPVISISPVYPEGAVPYLVRAWLLENEDIPFFTVTRVVNANDNNTHIEGGAELTYPHPLGEMELSSEMIGGPLTIGYDWTEDNAGSAGSTIQPNAFAAPSEMSQGEISIAVRVYYYKADATQSGQKALRDGSEAPADGYGYGEGNGSDEGIPTAVSSIYADREVVDVKYVNIMGMQSDKPFDGVNIVVTRYSDGSITTTKVLK